MFTRFIAAVKQQFSNVQNHGQLFQVASQVDRLYIAFMEPYDEVFRSLTSTVHTCRNCSNFLRRYGNIVSIDAEGKLVTVFDNIQTGIEKYDNVAAQLAQRIREANIVGIFVQTYDELVTLPYERNNKTQNEYQVGMASNVRIYTHEEGMSFGIPGIQLPGNEVLYSETFNHFNGKLLKANVSFSNDSKGKLLADANVKAQLLQKALGISVSYYKDTLEFIKCGALRDAEKHIETIEKLIQIVENNDGSNVYLWKHSLDAKTSMFINSLLGKFVEMYASGEKEIEEAVLFYNKQADPLNYKQASAPVSRVQIENAVKYFNENGYMESLSRRHATMNDIDVNEIRHINRGNVSKAASVFDSIKPTKTPVSLKREDFAKCPTIAMQQFMDEIIPKSSSIEILFESKNANNLSIITTAENPESKGLFSWNNQFSWTNRQGLAGHSKIAEAVRAQGGAVEGAIMRASLSWGENEVSNNTDLDLHIHTPHDEHIYYARATGYRSGSALDVDIRVPNDHGNKNIVENIVFKDAKKLIDGVYSVWVEVFSNRRGEDFQVEVAVPGTILVLEYKGNYRTSNVKVANIIVKNGTYIIKPLLPVIQTTGVSESVWGIDTNQFHPVNLVCLSPNHWGENNSGNRHYFFSIPNCKSDVELRAIHNENLKGGLLEYRKVIQLLGKNITVKPGGDQLAGLMLNATMEDSIIVKAVVEGKSIVYNVSVLN